MSRLGLTIKSGPMLDIAEPKEYHVFQRIVRYKRGSRGAAHAAKSLRWSVK